MAGVLQKKVCMLGAFSVGKTSLVRRYVESIFSDAYLTTVGVKIDKKTVEVSGQPVALILWDIAGEDEVSMVRMSYLRGAAGYLLVADGTRAATLEVARSLRARVAAELGPLPFTLLVNKADLAEAWAVSDGELDALRAGGWSVLRTSAKTGESVEDAFRELAVRVTR
jgi:small GTP-binding protein